MTIRRSAQTPAIQILAILLLSLTPVRAQEGFDASPAKQLERYAPLIGNWRGDGVMKEPSGVETKWTAHGSYAWALNRHFVREDFVVTFDGNAVPIVFHNYLGWDRENQRYVSIFAASSGEVRLQESWFAADGAMVQVTRNHQQGVPYAERATTRVNGDEMLMAIDMLMAEGASLTVVHGTMRRCEEVTAEHFGVGGFMGVAPGEQMSRLGRLAGVYGVDGQMVMMPGAPEQHITGTETYRAVFGGNVMISTTIGEAEGSPEEYAAQTFWGWNAHDGCIDCVYVDNMGSVGAMQVRWVDDKLVSTSSGLMMGQPTTQHFVVELDGKGHCKTAIGHTASGAKPPFVSFRASYTRRS